jgi:hypothetical protein
LQMLFSVGKNASQHLSWFLRWVLLPPLALATCDGLLDFIAKLLLYVHPRFVHLLA